MSENHDLVRGCLESLRNRMSNSKVDSIHRILDSSDFAMIGVAIAALDEIENPKDSGDPWKTAELGCCCGTVIDTGARVVYIHTRECPTVRAKPQVSEEPERA